MKRFTPIILAALLGTGSVLAFSQNADASPDDRDRYHYNHDRDRDRDREHWGDRDREREHWGDRDREREHWHRRREHIEGELFISSNTADSKGRTYLEFFQTDRDGNSKGIVLIHI